MIMFGLGTIVNTAAIIAGGILGWLDSDKICKLCDLQHPVRLVITLGYAKDETIRPKKRKDLSQLVTEI